MSQPKADGSTWNAIFDGKLWPVVLCGDSSPPERFLDSRQSAYHRPAILLGRHKYIWVTDSRLYEIDPNGDYSCDLWERQGDHWYAKDRHDRAEQARCNAFNQDLVTWENDVYWSNYLANETEARRLFCESTSPRGKRSYPKDEFETSDHELNRWPSGDVRSQLAGAWKGWSAVVRTQGPTPEQTPVKRRRRSDSDDVTKVKDESEDDSLFVGQAKAAEGPRINGSDDIAKCGSEDFKDDPSPEKLQEKHRLEVVEKGNNYNQIAIFVGEEHKPFFLSRDNAGKCDFLSDLVHFNNEIRSHIKLYEESDITAEQFEPVHEYLSSKEFKPRLFKRENSQQLEGVFMPEDKDEAAMKLVSVYATAAKLHFDALQERCVRKLQALYPLSALSLMLLVMSSENVESQTGNRDEHLRAWLVDHTAEQFFKLYEQNHMTMTRLMEEYPDFREDVIDRLSVHRDARMREMT